MSDIWYDRLYRWFGILLHNVEILKENICKLHGDIYGEYQYLMIFYLVKGCKILDALVLLRKNRILAYKFVLVNVSI